MWPAEEMICMQALQEARLTSAMPSPKNLGKKTGIQNRGEDADEVNLIATTDCHGDRAGGFPMS